MGIEPENLMKTLDIIRDHETYYEISQIQTYWFVKVCESGTWTENGPRMGLYICLEMFGSVCEIRFSRLNLHFLNMFIFIHVWEDDNSSTPFNH